MTLGADKANYKKNTFNPKRTVLKVRAAAILIPLFFAITGAAADDYSGIAAAAIVQSQTDFRMSQAQNTPQASSEQNPKYINYQVRRGDSLGLLAEYFGTTIANIRSSNGITGDTIYIGQTLKIPAQFTEYKVAPGDTLYSISKRYGTTVKRIMLFNNLKSSKILPGQMLYVPYVSGKPTVTFITHTVAAGDTSWTISLKYGIPKQELLNVNRLSESSVLSIGQKLTIPVYTIPLKPTPGPQYGEYLDWWTEAQYLFPIGKTATIIDFATGKTFTVERTIGASHSDTEPLTPGDAKIIKELWGGRYSWRTRAVVVVVDGRKIAASMASMPHGIEYIADNNFNGHFDIHFKNSRRHKDDAVDTAHQAKIRISAGINVK